MIRPMTRLRMTVLLGLALTAALTVASGTSASSSTAYGGLGAKAAAFRAQNPQGHHPSLGQAFIDIDRTRGGRVIAYHIEVNAKNHWTNRERIALLGGINLPVDATETNLNGNTCIVWRSATLKRLMGNQRGVKLRPAAG
jgi:hypothetical protein